jgi:hypothetical protein
MSTKREQRLEKERQAREVTQRETFKIDDKKSFLKKYLLFGGAGLLILAGVVTFFVRAGQPEAFDITQTCVTQEKFHIHPHLTININGQMQTIPQGIGSVPGCYRWLHTHDNAGTIHEEAPYPQVLTLGQFFQVWGQRFDKDHILNYSADGKHQLSMTVDGKPSDKWGNLALQDKQQILITYAEKK